MKKTPFTFCIVTLTWFMIGSPLTQVHALANVPNPIKSSSISSSSPTSEHVVISIPAAAFQPVLNGYDYENHGRYLFHNGPSGSNGIYEAAIYLPEGADVMKMTLYYYDTDAANAVAVNLIRVSLLGNSTTMGSTFSNTNTGFGSSSTTALSYNTIINSDYSYSITWSLPPVGSAVRGCAVVIEYEQPDYSIANPLYSAMPVADFTPWADGYGYKNLVNRLVHVSSPGGGTAAGTYLAPINLPDGASVSEFKIYYFDANTSGDVQAWLQRIPKANPTSWVDMAYCTSSGWSGVGYISDTTIGSTTIDNDLYDYQVAVLLPATATEDINLTGVRIAYSYYGLSDNYLSANASGFGRTFYDDYDFDNQARFLFHWHNQGGGTGNGTYFYPVYLPQGAFVTQLQYYFWDKGTSRSQLIFQRTELGSGNYENLGSVSSVYTTAGYANTGNGSITGGAIDNSRYAYWAIMSLPVSPTVGHTNPSDGDVLGCGLKFSYGEDRIMLPLIISP